MSNEVYANGREIACKAADSKSIAAFPDVCFTPPQTPATPPGVPIPYPNTGMASDATDGSKSVKISAKEVMLKDKSYFKKSSGDEAGNAPKKGIITSTNRGKVYFTSWSMDVKFEGENVVRHLDLTTHNHNPKPGNSAPTVHKGKSAKKTARPEKCRLRKFSEGCPSGQTAHHCVPDHCFRKSGENGKYYPGAVQHADGLCVCVTGSTKTSSITGKRISRKNFKSDTEHAANLAQHGRIHLKFDKLEQNLGTEGNPVNSTTLGKLEDAAADVVSEVTGCDRNDLKKQLRDYHKSNNLPAKTPLRADPFGRRPSPRIYLTKTVATSATSR